MGKTMLGGTTRMEDVNLLTPEQQNYLTKAMGGLSQMGQQQSPEDFQNMFQQSFVQPAQQMLQRQIVPAIKEQFMGMDESGSSALNQALAQSATDLSSALGSQLMDQYNLGQNRQLQSLGQLGQLGTARTFAPQFEHNQGLLAPLLSGLTGAIGGAVMPGGLLTKLLGGLGGTQMSLNFMNQIDSMRRY